MPGRINHLATWVAAIVYFLWGYLWFGVLFGTAWAQLTGHAMSAPDPKLYIESFLLGLLLSYGASIALSRRPEDQTVAQGISFALFMGILLYGTQTLNGFLYEGRPLMLWLIDAGYVIIGFAIIGAIVGGWKTRSASGA
jgi:Protein of unknown function (DUF1761)